MSASPEKPRVTRSRACAGVNADESPIAWLRRRKDRSGEAMISQAQFDAGERLRVEFWFAQMTPRTGRRRARAVRCAYRRLLPLEGSGGGRARGRLAAEVGQDRAALALTSLARHYGLETAPHAGGKSGVVRHWGSGDYRPMSEAPGDPV